MLPFAIGAILPEVRAEQGVFAEFDGSGGEIISVVARSVAFDTVVELIDPDGEVLAYNDDREMALDSGLDSELVAILPVAGRYRVRVAAFDGVGSGAYELVVVRVVARTLVLGVAARGEL